MRPVKASLFAICLGTTALAQQPLSAIDWLDDAISVPLTQNPSALLNEPPVSKDGLSPDVAVMPLDGATPDAAGLLASSTTGLPRTLWSASATDDLVRELSKLSPEPLPAIQSLYYTLLLAEADAPADAKDKPKLLTARIAALKAFGAVEPARALLERAGPARAGLFDHWLDLALLSGTEDEACKLLRAKPALSNSYAARIFCTARTGDWSTAALTYETALALDHLSKTEEILLAQFLDPEMIEGNTPPVQSKSLTPLDFRLFEAVGHPLATRDLPRAFAMADLRDTAGWKAEIEAAERLTQTGALPANHLFGLYTERKPAASGGVWDRVHAVQRLDKALESQDQTEISRALPDAWASMKGVGLEVAFAQFITERLRPVELRKTDQELAFLIALLSPDYENSADLLDAPNQQQRFLISLAKGEPDKSLATTVADRAIASAFESDVAHPDHEALLKAGKLGQTILAAATQLDRASPGNLSEISSALSTLRSVGLEDIARRAALQLLILGRA